MSLAFFPLTLLGEPLTLFYSYIHISPGTLSLRSTCLPSVLNMVFISWLCSESQSRFFTCCPLSLLIRINFEKISFCEALSIDLSGLLVKVSQGNICMYEGIKSASLNVMAAFPNIHLE